MVRYSYTKAVNPDKLDSEIKALSLPYLYLDTSGINTIAVWMSQDLSPLQEAQLTTCIENHVPLDMQAAVMTKIVAAMGFGRNLIAQYGAANVLAGYSVTQIQEIMTRTAGVMNALNTGSLYVAIDELNKVQTDDVIITPEKITFYRHKIQDYLGIPRT